MTLTLSAFKSKSTFRDSIISNPCSAMFRKDKHGPKTRILKS